MFVFVCSFVFVQLDNDGRSRLAGDHLERVQRQNYMLLDRDTTGARSINMLASCT